MNEDYSIKQEPNVESSNIDIKVSLVLDKLKTALSAVERVVNARAALPILNHILIKADKSGVEILATDLEMGVRMFLGGKVEHEGMVTVPGKTFISLVASLKGETLELTSKANVLTLVCGETKARVNSLDAEEFPVIPEVASGKTIKLQGRMFKDLLSSVDFAASRDESRPVLTGVYLYAKDGVLTAAATDSFRLAETIIELPAAPEFGLVIPARTLQEVKRIVGDEEEFTLHIEENQVMFSLANGSLVSRLIEGEYPNYKQIIPQVSTTVAEVDTGELVDALKTASIFSLESSNNVKFNITPDGIDIGAESSQVGNFSARVSAKVTGEGGDISFNAKYLIEGLGSFDTPRCGLEITNKTSPGVFKPTGAEGRLYMVMPLRS